ncbi:Dihydroorotate dehydrogenase A (fumarate) [Ceratocystis fimbriata CBS 114723]|uniref:Dihydroorotate dehydrogenase A (Fumarate) n=1 Tax=Ceratocystis fimbriata CBS 114723 TaxID=1035309 RepID=A0A2C5XIE2_9PEZI|nr:Dihydroorotate dehydrogenase A (fumarate) [Ceratocystis fimbriata CBS 114723]
MPPKLLISPPVLNSACPWATDLTHLESLYASSSTGAITTRTCTLHGFAHDDGLHRYLFFDPASLTEHTDSLPSTKPIIISIAGPIAELAACYAAVQQFSKTLDAGAPPLALEINLSCPNIRDHPPPAYDGEGLTAVLKALPTSPTLPIGIKTPPYTYAGQFAMLREALRAADAGQRISFVTATNTLGSCVALDVAGNAILPAAAAGLAGPPLHPLALGNVRAIREALDSEPSLRCIDVIGVGGVEDAQGFRRMKAAGAEFVALATAVGRRGVVVFDEIANGILM